MANQEILFKKLFNKDKRLQISVKKKKKDYHLIHGVEDVVVDILLCVNGKGVIWGLIVVLEEDVLEGHSVLLLKGHHHLVTEAKQHQLQQKQARGIENDVRTIRSCDKEKKPYVVRYCYSP